MANLNTNKTRAMMLALVVVLVLSFVVGTSGIALADGLSSPKTVDKCLVDPQPTPYPRPLWPRPLLICLVDPQPTP